MTEKSIAIIQARMGSSRLPDKVLLDIGGRPMLAWVVERTRRALCLHDVVVATTVDLADDAVAKYCISEDIPFFRGSLHDVLDRYYQAARHFQADQIVRITADCPLIDPQLIDHTYQEFYSKKADFSANRLPPPWGRTYPIGLDIEICTLSALETAWQEATELHHREHVMPYLYENQDHFKVVLVNHHKDYGDLRWTVDTPQDLKLVREIVSRFPDRDDFSWLDVLMLFENEPHLADINASVQPKVYREVDDRAA